jgi:hypothetical protein
MAAFTVNSTPTPPTPYAQDLADIPALQVQNTSIKDAYVNEMTIANLVITTNGTSFIHSGTGNDTITDNSQTPGYVVINPDGGTNTIHASSNPASHDTIIVDAEPDAPLPLTDTIIGLKAMDNVLIKGLTALSPNDFTNAAGGLALVIHPPGVTSSATIVLSGYTTSDFAAGRLKIGMPFISTDPNVSSYQLLQVVR